MNKISTSSHKTQTGRHPNQSRHTRLQKTKDEVAPKLSSRNSPSKQTNHARRLPTHTNKVGDQPNNHWGLVYDSQ